MPYWSLGIQGFTMKIGFATNDWSRSMKNDDGTPCLGGSGYIRIGQYIPELLKLGHNPVLGILAHHNGTKKFGIHDFKGGDHFDCDVIVMQRYMHRDAVRDTVNAVQRGQIIINDIDDWYWGLSDKNAAYSMTHPNFNKVENINHYKDMVNASSGIITSTPFLTEKMLKWNNNVAMQQNYVTMSTFRKRNNFNYSSPVVGWMGSTAHRSGDLQILRGFTNSINKNVRWHHTGHIESPHFPKFWDELKISSGNVSRTNFLRPHELHNGMDFDIGIVPLADLSFNSAKSWIKGIEYAAAGIPFIASGLDEYTRLKEEYNIGITVKRPRDFINAINKLLDSKGLEEESERIYQNVKALDISIGACKLVETIERISNEAR